jgi:translation initiation factor 2 beta subunit (eIF-2beta)/eIF-5
MASFIDIDEDKSLVGERYLIPEPVIKHISSKGGETHIINSKDIMNYVKREVSTLADYFKFGGCIVKIDDGIIKINKIITLDEIKSHIEIFMNDFVKCYSCSNPETTFMVESDRLYLSCKACGFKSLVAPKTKQGRNIIQKIIKSL